MVISFYPGGGGNRYYNSINGKEYETFNRSYDKSVIMLGNDQKFRYLNDDVIYEYDDEITILTHCLNFEKIQHHFPKMTKFVILNTDFKSSLRRQWCLEGKQIYNREKKKYSKLDVYNTIKEQSWPIISNEDDLKNLPDHLIAVLATGIIGDNYYSGTQFDVINSAFSSICYHKNYYNTHPPTMLTIPGVEVVNCTHNTKNFTEFSRIIINELDRYTSKEFDFAWNTYERIGADAPILSLWESYSNQKL